MFGGNEASAADLETARRFGAAIARAGAVLLTGGVGNSAAEVKEQAIDGAVAAGGAWVGVENSGTLTPPRRVRGGLVVSPGVGHRRNFIGAALCDAAIALSGEDGTASEVVFALALGRPVVLYDRVPAADLVTAAQRRVPVTDGPALLDRLIAAAYERPARPPYRVGTDVPAETVVARLVRTPSDPVDLDALVGLRDRAAWDVLLAERADGLR